MDSQFSRDAKASLVPPLSELKRIQIFHRIIRYRIKEHTSSALTVCLSYTSIRVFDTLFCLIFQMSLTPMIFKYTKFLEFLKGTSYPISGVKSDTSGIVKIVIWYLISWIFNKNAGNDSRCELIQNWRNVSLKLFDTPFTDIKITYWYIKYQQVKLLSL